MRALLGTLFVFLSFPAAHAAFDVICLDGDCLVGGWELTDMSSGERSSVRCTNQDCGSEGWVSEYKGEDHAEVICKPRGCFLEGWRTFDTKSGMITADATCYRGFSGRQDCMLYGWETYSRAYGRYPTLCLYGDCAYRGWETRYPGYQPQVTRCKAGGCFTTGWTVRP